LGQNAVQKYYHFYVTAKRVLLLYWTIKVLPSWHNIDSKVPPPPARGPKVLLGPRPRLLDHTQIIHTHTHTHTHGRTPLNEGSAHRRGRYLHNTQQTQGTYIHALSGIQTRDRSNQAAADLHLRQHGHRDRQEFSYIP
jgi:hypothetical protein